MVQVDIPAAFTMGQVFAIVARHSLKSLPSLTDNRFLLLTNWYMALILAPAALFLLVGWPGWETMYQWAWIENSQFHPFVALFYTFFFIVLVVLGNAGFILVHWLLRNDRRKLIRAILVVSVICTLLPFLIDIEAPIYIGSYQDYHDGSASLVFGTSFIWSWLGIMLYWAVGSIAMLIKVYIEAKFKQHQLFK